MDAPAGPSHLRAEPIDAERLRLEPLRVSHADELVTVLDDTTLHTYIGGRPATLEELRGRFDIKAGGCSADGVQTWLNWVIRVDGCAAGYVQATITPWPEGPRAELAWVVGMAHQRRGLAVESAAAVAQWLAARQVHHLVAHVHPDNTPSRVVAERVGMHPTDVIVDGETQWVRLPRHHKVRSNGPPAGP